MLLIAGIVPDNDFPLTVGTAGSNGDSILVNNFSIPLGQGTAAMIGAALAVTEHLGLAPPCVMLAGDTGSGQGSRLLYQHLIEQVVDLSPQVLALHYWLPSLLLCKRLCEAVRGCRRRPVMIADAASMYAAKAAGTAPEFDLFTPDASEIAFLADPDAVHPAYIRRHLFEEDITKAPELIDRAYRQKGAAKFLLVKGAVDYFAAAGEIIDKVDEPDIPELECIGGTGDTITGLAAAFIYAGLDIRQAAFISAKTNRIAGKLCRVSPATRVDELIRSFPEVFKDNLCTLSSACMFKERSI